MIEHRLSCADQAYLIRCRNGRKWCEEVDVDSRRGGERSANRGAARRPVLTLPLVVHPEHAGLYFIGLVQPWGAIMPLAEEQARWVADLLEGKCQLPPKSEMLRVIDRDRAVMRRRYTSSPRHTIQVDFYPYLATLRKERRRGLALGEGEAQFAD